MSRWGSAAPHQQHSCTAPSPPPVTLPSIPDLFAEWQKYLLSRSAVDEIEETVHNTKIWLFSSLPSSSCYFSSASSNRTEKKKEVQGKRRECVESETPVRGKGESEIHVTALWEKKDGADKVAFIDLLDNWLLHSLYTFSLKLRHSQSLSKAFEGLPFLEKEKEEDTKSKCSSYGEEYPSLMSTKQTKQVSKDTSMNAPAAMTAHPTHPHRTESLTLYTVGSLYGALLGAKMLSPLHHRLRAVLKSFATAVSNLSMSHVEMENCDEQADTVAAVQESKMVKGKSTRKNDRSSNIFTRSVEVVHFMLGCFTDASLLSTAATFVGSPYLSAIMVAIREGVEGNKDVGHGKDKERGKVERNRECFHSLTERIVKFEELLSTKSRGEMQHPPDRRDITEKSLVQYFSPFRANIDSKRLFRTVEEQSAYNNRERARDAFCSLLREHSSQIDARAAFSQRRSFQDGESSGLLTPGSSLGQRASGLVADISERNIPWFAALLLEQLLTQVLSVAEETDPNITKLANANKLKLLHRRLSHQNVDGQQSKISPLRSAPLSGVGKGRRGGGGGGGGGAVGSGGGIQLGDYFNENTKANKRFGTNAQGQLGVTGSLGGGGGAVRMLKPRKSQRQTKKSLHFGEADKEKKKEGEALKEKSREAERNEDKWKGKEGDGGRGRPFNSSGKEQESKGGEGGAMQKERDFGNDSSERWATLTAVFSEKERFFPQFLDCASSPTLLWHLQRQATERILNLSRQYEETEMEARRLQCTILSLRALGRILSYIVYSPSIRTFPTASPAFEAQVEYAVRCEEVSSVLGIDLVAELRQGLKNGLIMLVLAWVLPVIYTSTLDIVCSQTKAYWSTLRFLQSVYNSEALSPQSKQSFSDAHLFVILELELFLSTISAPPPPRLVQPPSMPAHRHQETHAGQDISSKTGLRDSGSKMSGDSLVAQKSGHCEENCELWMEGDVRMSNMSKFIDAEFRERCAPTWASSRRILHNDLTANGSLKVYTRPSSSSTPPFSSTSSSTLPSSPSLVSSLCTSGAPSPLKQSGQQRHIVPQRIEAHAVKREGRGEEEKVFQEKIKSSFFWQVESD